MLKYMQNIYGSEGVALLFCIFMYPQFSEKSKEKAKELGFAISSYINEDEVELEYIYCNDYIYLEEDGNITTSTENIVAENRTPDQMYQIMLALR